MSPAADGRPGDALWSHSNSCSTPAVRAQLTYSSKRSGVLTAHYRMSAETVRNVAPARCVQLHRSHLRGESCHNLRMKSGDCTYIWELDDWPRWRFDLATLAGPLADASRARACSWAAWPMSAWRCAAKPACRR